MTLNECLWLTQNLFSWMPLAWGLSQASKNQTMVVAALWFSPPSILTKSTEKSVLICWRDMLRRTGRMTSLPKQGVIFPVRLGGSSLGIMIHDLNHSQFFWLLGPRCRCLWRVFFVAHLRTGGALGYWRERGERKKPFLTLPDVFLSMFFLWGGVICMGNFPYKAKTLTYRWYEVGCTWHSVCVGLGVTIFKAPRSTKSKLSLCVKCNRFYRIREMISTSNGCFLYRLKGFRKQAGWETATIVRSSKIPSWRMDDFLPKHYLKRSQHPLRFCQWTTSQ